MADIIQHYLSYSRTTPHTLHEVDLNAVIQETVEQFTPLFQRQQVEVSTYLADIPLLHQADGASLQRVLINVLNNAVDSLMETRRIAIATYRGVLSETGQSGVFLDVQDTGGGIPPEHLPQVFHWFFTAKKTQPGTGLGLAICQEIVKAHNGKIVKVGTTVQIFLPCS